MKFMKKIAAMAAATAVAAVSLVSMGSMGASATDEPPYTAYLCISAGGDAQWKAGDWETESAAVKRLQLLIMVRLNILCS